MANASLCSLVYHRSSTVVVLSTTVVLHLFLNLTQHEVADVHDDDVPGGKGGQLGLVAGHGLPARERERKS